MKEKPDYQVNGKPKSAPDGVDWLLIRTARKAAQEKAEPHKRVWSRPDVKTRKR